MHAVGRIEEQRGERRCGRYDRVTQAPGHREARAVAAAFWQRLSAGGEDDGGGVKAAAVGHDAKAAAGGFDVEHAMTRGELCAGGLALTEQGIEHVPRTIGIGEQLAAGLFMQRHADLTEERDRLAHGKRAQHAPDGRGRAAPEIALGDDGVGHVAAGSAADKDLRAGSARAVEENNRTGAIETAGENRGGQAGRAGADDRDAARRRELGCQSRSLPCRRRRQASSGHFECERTRCSGGTSSSGP